MVFILTTFEVRFLKEAEIQGSKVGCGGNSYKPPQPLQPALLCDFTFDGGRSVVDRITSGMVVHLA